MVRDKEEGKEKENVAMLAVVGELKCCCWCRWCRNLFTKSVHLTVFDYSISFWVTMHTVSVCRWLCSASKERFGNGRSHWRRRVCMLCKCANGHLALHWAVVADADHLWPGQAEGRGEREMETDWMSRRVGEWVSEWVASHQFLCQTISKEVK